MYKKWTKFLLVVVACLAGETIAMAWCFNSYVNNNKIEKGSVFTNLADGWKSFSKSEEEKAVDSNNYVEPFKDHYIYINFDAKSGDIVYGHELGEKYYIWNAIDMYDDEGNYKEDYEPYVAIDNNGNEKYVTVADRYYYATSTNDPSDYMYIKAMGDQYLYATSGNLELLYNGDGGMVLSGPRTKLPEEDVSFDKDAKFYYMIVLGSGALSVSSIIGLSVVAIINKKSQAAMIAGI